MFGWCLRVVVPTVPVKVRSSLWLMFWLLFGQQSAKDLIHRSSYSSQGHVLLLDCN